MVYFLLADRCLPASVGEQYETMGLIAGNAPKRGFVFSARRSHLPHAFSWTSNDFISRIGIGCKELDKGLDTTYSKSRVTGNRFSSHAGAFSTYRVTIACDNCKTERDKYK